MSCLIGAILGAVNEPLSRRLVVGGAAVATFPALATLADTSSLCVSIVEFGDTDVATSRDVTGVSRRITCRASNNNAILISFFDAANLMAMQEADQRSNCKHAHYFNPTNFRAAALEGDSPRYFDVLPESWPPLRKDSGIMFGAHGLTVGYQLWLSKFTSDSSDAEHHRDGVTQSVVGPLTMGSTDAPLPGPSVLHATRRADDATYLARQLDPMVDPRVKQALDLGVIRAPLYATSATVLKDETLL